jgi:sortase A
LADRIRYFLRGVGQTLITFGVVVLLFVVYEVWVTNWFSERENHRILAKLEKQWALPGADLSALKIGDAMGVLYIPRLGSDFKWAIVEGDRTPNQDQLAKGPAHYHDTALPGQVGNFALAGHRVGKGEPFLNLDHLKSGDAVIVATRDAWYVYQVIGDPTGKNPQKVTEQIPAKTVTGADASVTLPGREIVGAGNGDPLYPVPDNKDLSAVAKLMTMTTCHPKFTAENRMIVYAKLAFVVPGNGDVMPARVKALYDEVA